MPENVLQPVQRLFRLLQVDKKEISQVYIYALFIGLVNLSLPLGIQAIINLIQGGEVSTAWFVLVVFVILGILFTGVFQLMQLRIVENIAQRIFSRASFEFAYRIPRIQYKALYKYYAPELANRFFDTVTIQKGLPKILIDFSLAAFQIIVGLIVLSLYHPFFILYGVVLIALVYTLLALTGPKGLKTSLEESKHKYGVAHWLEEIARTKLSFKLIDHPAIAMDQTDESVTKYIKARESHFKVLVNQFLNLIGFKVLIAAGLLIIGSLLVFSQEMNIGQFVAAEIIIILIISSVEKLIQSLDSIYDVLTALEKIGYVTDMALDNDKGIQFDESEDGIETSLHEVSFSFPDSRKPILNNVSLEIAKGTSACIVGPSGSGKSTLMALWSGIIEPSSGVIKFNGYSLQSLDLSSLKKQVGIALSNNDIFFGTFMDNITMGRKEISQKALMQAIETVQLQEFLSTLKNGLSTKLDPEAKRLPRSVANKIILARAIVSRPRLLMLEDPLDHVPKDEKEIIIRRLVDPANPWSIIITTVDATWSKYISKKIVLKDGEITQVIDQKKK
jgi:ABC-type bacteriocin/lantibiotic exporter with double-glycine peptidase domain